MINFLRIKKWIRSNRYLFLFYRLIISLKKNGIRKTYFRGKQKISLKLRQKKLQKYVNLQEYTYDDFIIDGVKYFDDTYYYKNYPDIKKSGQDALSHYLQSGWKEGRQTSESFDPNKYCLHNPDVQALNINPLLHYIEVGRKEKRCILFEVFSLQKNYCRKKIVCFKKSIDIIIPICNGFAFLSPLFNSIFLNTAPKYRLIVVNDASSDKKVLPLLEKIKSEKPTNCDFLLLNNQENLGFVKSVNKAAEYVKDHFVLLNSDTEVPEGWLKRLIKPFYTEKKIASITPFTNSGVFFSYPAFGTDNKLPHDLSLKEIDAAFSRISDKISDDCVIHSGTGFCMAINYNCWKDIGPLDAETFGKGYGEENDWCFRAIDRGYQNVLVPNLFVFHNHGGSFIESEKQKLIDSHLSILFARYPKQMDSVSAFVSRDPFAKYRLLASIYLSESKKGALLFIDFDAESGGAYHYRENKIKELTAEGYNVLLITHHEEQRQTLTFTGIDNKQKFVSDFLTDISFLFDLIEIKKIFVNNFLFFPQYRLFALFETLTVIKENLNFELEYVFHDFLSICPSFFLIAKENVYCNLPDNAQCCNCFNANKNNTILISDILLWRKKWEYFLTLCDTLTCFSHTTQKIILQKYPFVAEKLSVIPHKVLVQYTDTYAPINWIASKRLTIGFFGAFALAKGSEILVDLAKKIKDDIPDAVILCFGYNHTGIKFPETENLKYMGLYDKNHLPQILNENQIDITIFTSIWPETFSYVVQELMLTNVPILSFNQGAPSERLQNYQKGIITKENTSDMMLTELKKIYQNIEILRME